MKMGSPVSWDRFLPSFDSIFLSDDESWFRTVMTGGLPEVSVESTPRRELTARRDALADAGQSLTEVDGNFLSTVMNYLKQAQCGYAMRKSIVKRPNLPLLSVKLKVPTSYSSSFTSLEVKDGKLVLPDTKAAIVSTTVTIGHN